MVYLYVTFLTRKILRMWSAKTIRVTTVMKKGVANGNSSLILSVLILAFSSF